MDTIQLIIFFLSISAVNIACIIAIFYIAKNTETKDKNKEKGIVRGIIDSIRHKDASIYSPTELRKQREALDNLTQT